MTVVKGKNEHVFGGYVTVPFSSDIQSHYDYKAFFFSLTNHKKFPINACPLHIIEDDIKSSVPGFGITGHNLEVFGYCVDCQNQ